MKEKNTLQELADAIRLLAASRCDLMRIDDAALYLGVAKSTLYHHCNNGSLPYFKHLKNVWFRRADLDRWITTGRTACDEEIDVLAERYIQSLKQTKRGKL